MRYTNYESVELPPCNILRELFKSGETRLTDGKVLRLAANVSSLGSKVLYRAVSEHGSVDALEIGMAFGVSSLSILSGLRKTGGRLTSIDPYVGWPSARQAAINHIAQAGFEEAHTHIADFSFRALPRLLLDGTTFDFIYIDGAHDYDNVIIDYLYADKLLRRGGIVGFNDVGWPDVWPVVRRISKRSDYQEVDLGVKPDFHGRTVAHSLARRVMNWPRHDRFFRKLS